jgi:hypothetical protein
MSSRNILPVVTALTFLPCAAWSPKVHALQTRLAKGLVPKAMAGFLDQHAGVLAEASGGIGAAKVPTPEDVEAQFRKVLEISEARGSAKEIAHELGRLGNMVQLLTDPSATSGFTFTRLTFSDFADEHIKKLVAVREPMFAAKGDLNPMPAIQAWNRVKYERFRLLSNCVNHEKEARSGAWDTLSVPFAQMQLGFSAGVNATANMWIYAWRAAGSFWTPQENAQTSID